MTLVENMASHDATKVLAMNFYVLGHITFHDVLERTFQQKTYGIDFHGLKLTKYNHSIPARIANRLLTFRALYKGPNDWDFYRFRTELSCSILATAMLKESAKSFHPDVIFVHTQALGLLSKWLWPHKMPVVLSIDDTSALLLKGLPKNRHYSYLPIVALERSCFSGASHIVTWSNRARNSVITDYRIPEEKVTTISPGIPLNDFMTIERHSRTCTGRIRLLFVGNDFNRKGGPELLSVFADGLSEFCDLDIVSNDPLAVTDHPRVRIHRGLAPLSPEILDLFRAADIFVLPTKSEQFGVVFIEAMAAGLPIVTTSIMAVPEIVHHEVTGLLVSLGNMNELHSTLLGLAKDRELRIKLGNAGRALAKKEFDATTNAARLAAVFKLVSADNNRER